MIVKVCQFKARRERGERFAEVFHPGEMEKAASFFSMEKTAAPLLPQVRAYLEKLKPDPSRIYVLVNALGAGEYWGCFPAGAPVQTKNGWVPIEEVEIGTEVLTHQNRWCPVTATQVRDHDDELWDLEIAGLPRYQPYISATPNHEMYVVLRDELVRSRRKHLHKRSKGVSRNEGRDAFLRELPFDWTPISELRTGDYVLQPFPVGEAPGFGRWSDTGIALLAGVYAAEGCIANRYDKDMLPDTDPCYKIIYTLGPTRQDIAEKIKAVAEQHNYHPTIKEGESCIRVELCWSDLARFLRDNVGHHATEKYLSNEILTMPRKWQEEFFHWYAEGDGYVNKTGKGEGTVRCSSASLQLLYDLRLLLARLGKVGQITGRHNEASSFYNGNPIFELSVSGTQMRDDVRNVEAYIHPDGYILSPVRKVSARAFHGKVYNIEVEEDESYTIGGLAVHNSNINGDWFPEASLIHEGPVYGYETFYQAYPYKHHVNKNPEKSFGKVVLSCWNDEMKRVELIVEIDRHKAKQFGAEDVCDRLDRGMFPDVSMGCRVPYDLCSKCLDWEKYRKAQSTFNPSRHRTVGAAVLEFHKKNPIRGLSVTRNDYCEHLKMMLNKILEDGTKIYAINDYPRFFDISFVFIGADKTAKVMAKLASASDEGIDYTIPSWRVAEEMGHRQPDVEKEFEKVASTTSNEEAMLREVFQAHRPSVTPAGIATGLDKVRAKLREKKASQLKGAEIIKDVVPSQFGGKVMPVSRPDIPTDILDRLGKSDLSEALSTPTSMGMILKPREFQRITIIRMGKKPLADELDHKKSVFPPVAESDRSVPMGTGHFSSILKRLLLPLMEDRSLLEPIARRRIVRISICGKPDEEEEDLGDAEETPFLQKISAAYNGYLDRLDDCLGDVESVVDEHSDLWETIHGSGLADGFAKTASGISPPALLGPMGGELGVSQRAKWQKRRAIKGGAKGAMQHFGGR